MAIMHDENYICIKDGNFMERKKGNYFVSSKVTTELVKKAITEYLATNPSDISANSVIRQAVLKASGCKFFKHFQKKSEHPNCKISYDDPLYSELCAFIRQDKNYQQKIQRNAQHTINARKKREETLQQRLTNQELNAFLKTEKFRRVTGKR